MALGFGSILKGLGGTLFGGSGNAKVSERNVYNEGQQQFLNNLLSGLGGQGGGLDFLQGLYDPNSQTMQNMQQPYINQFNQQTIPGIAERFSGLGAGAQNSSAFGQALSSAAGDLQTNLASLGSQTQLQGLGPLLQLMQTALNPQTQQVVNQGTAGGGILGSFLGGLGGDLGTGLAQKWLPTGNQNNQAKFQGQQEIRWRND